VRPSHPHPFMRYRRYKGKEPGRYAPLRELQRVGQMTQYKFMCLYWNTDTEGTAFLSSFGMYTKGHYSRIESRICIRQVYKYIDVHGQPRRPAYGGALNPEWVSRGGARNAGNILVWCGPEHEPLDWRPNDVLPEDAYAR
jgi:hypothetical protein